MGGHRPQGSPVDGTTGTSDAGRALSSPWSSSGSSSGSGSAARDAGIDDIGRGSAGNSGGRDADRAGFLDNSSGTGDEDYEDLDHNYDPDEAGDFDDGDFGSDGGEN
jgi:uncharacterized protein